MRARTWHPWLRFWEPAIPIERLALVRILFAGYAGLDLVLHRGWIEYANAPALSYHAYGPLSWLHAPRLDSPSLSLLWVGALVAAVLATIGWRARVTLAVLVVTYAWWTLDHYSYGEPSHARTTLVTGLIALTLSPCGDALSIKAWRSARVVSGWPVEVIAVSLTYLYLTAAIAKLRFVGSDWWQGGATQTGIALLGPPWARQLSVDHPEVINVFALLALVFELAAPILLWRWRPRWAYSALAVVFHLAVLALMRVDFLPMAAACLAMFPLERILASTVERADPHHSPTLDLLERQGCDGDLTPTESAGRSTGDG